MNETAGIILRNASGEKRTKAIKIGCYYFLIKTMRVYTSDSFGLPDEETPIFGKRVWPKTGCRCGRRMQEIVQLRLPHSTCTWPGKTRAKEVSGKRGN